MKRCRKSLPEPKCLTDFRDEKPEGTWEELRDEARSCYGKIRGRLRDDQGGVCAYCEIDVVAEDEQIAHFHPKSDRCTERNWGLDWGNLWLACKGGSQNWMRDGDRYAEPLPENLSCDERKESRILDAEILSPGELPAFPRIFAFRQEPDRVMICADEDACREAGVPIEKAIATIDQMGLNCQRLATARLALHRQLEQAVSRIRHANIDPKVALERLVVRHLSPKTEGKYGSMPAWVYCR